MAGPASDSRRPPPLQKNLSRRVSFNESATLSGRSHKPPPSLATTDSSDDDDVEVGIGRPRRRGCGPICNSCCAWTSLVVGILLIVLLLLGGIYYAFLQSNLPEVRFQQLMVVSLNVTTAAGGGDTLLAARIVALLNTTNGSGKIELGYSSMTARLSSAGIDFPEVRVADVRRQEPRNATDLWVEPVVKGMAVEEAAAGELKDNADRHLMVVDVVVRGKVDFFVGGKRMMSGFPFMIDCRGIDQSEVDNGHAPRCTTKMTPIR